MGYGKNLKEILDRKDMTVKELARRAGIAPTTIYSIIQRDAAIRFDTALKISNILDIPINSICKDNPYDDMETLPELPSDTEKRNITSHKNAYISEIENINHLDNGETILAGRLLIVPYYSMEYVQ